MDSFREQYTEQRFNVQPHALNFFPSQISAVKEGVVMAYLEVVVGFSQGPGQGEQVINHQNEEHEERNYDTRRSDVVNRIVCGIWQRLEKRRGENVENPLVVTKWSTMPAWGQLKPNPKLNFSRFVFLKRKCHVRIKKGALTQTIA